MFTIFSQFWVLAFYLHYSEDVQPISLFLLGLIATLVMLMSSKKVIPFVIAIGVFTGINLFLMPFVANHSNFYTGVSLLVLIWLGYQWWRYGDLEESRLNAEFASFRGVLCLSLFVVYLMAGVHKLNYDFFNPEVSCATDFFYRYAYEYGFDIEFIPKFLKTWSPYLVSVIEVVGALMLVVPRLQLVGVLWFVGLHSYLAPLSFYDFASICYSILFLFLPVVIVSKPGYFKRIQKAQNIWIISMIVAGVAAAAMIDNEFQVIRQDVMQGWPFLAGSAYFIFVIVQILRTEGVGLFSFTGVSLYKGVPKWTLSLPLLLFIYTNTSYLGLRTAGNTTMFSNLRTEGSQNNHFFMPEWLQVFNYQKNLYKVTSVSANVTEWYRGMPSEGMIMTEFELARMIGEWKDRGLYVPMEIRNLETQIPESYENITQSDLWNQRRPNWFLRKTLLFREIQPFGEANLCRW